MKHSIGQPLAYLRETKMLVSKRRILLLIPLVKRVPCIPYDRGSQTTATSNGDQVVPPNMAQQHITWQYTCNKSLKHVHQNTSKVYLTSAVWTQQHSTALLDFLPATQHGRYLSIFSNFMLHRYCGYYRGHVYSGGGDGAIVLHVMS